MQAEDGLLATAGFVNGAGEWAVVTHIVIFKWTAGVAEQQIAALRDALDALATEMSELVTIRHGPDLHFRDGNGDYALVASFADRAGWASYQADPRHKALVQDFVMPIQASRLTIQI